MLVGGEVGTAWHAGTAIRVSVVVGGCAVEDADMGICVVVWVCGTHQDASIGGVVSIWVGRAPAVVHTSAIAKISIGLVTIDDTSASVVVGKVPKRSGRTRGCAGPSHILGIVIWRTIGHTDTIGLVDIPKGVGEDAAGVHADAGGEISVA